MPKLYTNNIYRYDFNDSVTNWKWRLDCICSDGVPQSTTSIIKLDEGTIQNIKFSWEYDKFPLGLPSKSPLLEVEINLNEVSNSDFIDILFNPVTEWNSQLISPVCFATGETLTLPNFATGNLFTLYVSYDGLTYYQLFRGIQSVGIEQGLNPAKQVLKIEIESLYMAILKMVDLSLLEYAYRITYNTTNVKAIQNAYFDFIILNSSGNIIAKGSNASGAGRAEDTQIYFYSFTAITLFLRELADYYLKVFTRNYSNTFINFPFPLPKLYEQIYDGTALQGALLDNYNDVCVTGLLTNKNYGGFGDGDFVVVGGLFTILSNTYKFLWDWYVDLTQAALFKGIIKPNQEAVFLPCNSNLNQLVINATVDDFEVTEIKRYADIIKRAECSYTEKMGADISKVEKVKSSTRVDNNYSIPIGLHNLPCVTDKAETINHVSTDKFKIKKYYLIDGTSFLVDRSYEFHTWGMYYVDLPSPAGKDLTTTYMPIRVHEQPNFMLTDTIDSNSVVTITQNNLSALEKISDVEALIVQQDSGIGNVLIQCLDFLFGSNNQTSIKANTTIDIGKVGNDLIWFNPQGYINIDLSKYAPIYKPTIYDDIPNKFDIIKMELNLNTGEVNLEMLNRTLGE